MVLFLSSCNFKLKLKEGDAAESGKVEIQRYDRLQSLYLTTGDFSALQQMSTDYPIETRTLLEKVLELGEVSDPEINSRFLTYFQDSTLQVINSDAEVQYANMNDLNNDLTDAFERLTEWLPNLPVPMIYAQMSALHQSIVVGDQSVGISIDKYLGADYPIYLKYYPEDQRKLMTRECILPDCISFYLLSRYPLPNFSSSEQRVRDLHMAKIQWVTNKAIARNFFKSPYISVFDKYTAKNPHITVAQLMEDTDYSKFLK
jgi:hypothetical protein